MKKVALIGLDGMSWRSILSYSNCFKNVIHLAANGLKGICWCIPPYTPPSWISISTGVKPQKHGILSFTKPKFSAKNRSTYISSYDISFPRISEMLALKGLKSLVINHIFSYPISGWVTKNHVLVSDDFSPQMFIYPEKFDKYSSYFKNVMKNKPNRRNDKWVLKLNEIVLTKVEGVFKLVDHFDPDFLWIMFKEPDTVMHYLQYVAAGIYNHRVARLFSSIDDFIGEIARRVDYVIIVSDHGFDVYIDRVNIFGVLTKHGIIQSQNILANFVSKLLSSKLSGYVTWSFLKSLNGLRIFYGIREFTRRFRRRAYDGNLTSADISTDKIDGDDAFIIYFSNNNIRSTVINVLNQYIGYLFDSIEYINIGDAFLLMIIPKKGLHFMNDFSLRGSPLLRFAASRHSPAGMFVLNGPNIKSSIKFIENSDVAPTILSLFDLPTATHFDGQSIINNRQGIENYLSIWKLTRKIGKLRTFIK